MSSSALASRDTSPNAGGGVLANEYEPVFLIVYEAPELIPRNEFRQPM
jgi:hypothetical protein